MAANQLKLPSSVRHVAFDPTGQWIAVLRDYNVDIVKWSIFNKTWVDKPEIVQTVK
jgi:hypothetical protein